MWRGAQLAIDTTLVSPLSRAVSASRRAEPRRSCIAESEKKEGEHVPRVIWRRWSGTPGCIGGRSWVLLERRGRSFCLPNPRRYRHHISSRRLRGCADGVPLWLAQQHRPSGEVTPSRPFMRLCGTTSVGVLVKRSSPDTENHEQNGYAKVYDDNNLFKTNVDNDNSDTTYTNMRNM